MLSWCGSSNLHTSLTTAKSCSRDHCSAATAPTCSQKPCAQGMICDTAGVLGVVHCSWCWRAAQPNLPEGDIAQHTRCARCLCWQACGIHKAQETAAVALPATELMTHAITACSARLPQAVCDTACQPEHPLVICMPLVAAGVLWFPR
jgi:hypothetical protein